jgi:hypothetical protein
MRENHGVEHPMYSTEIKEKIKQTNLEKYGVENYFQTHEFREKMSSNRKKKLSRPHVLVLRKYQELYETKFGANWSRKSDEYLEELFRKTIEKYGELPPCSRISSSNL